MSFNKHPYKLTKIKNDPQRGLRLLYKLFEPHLKDFVFIFLALIASSIVAFAIPYYIKVAIDQNIVKKDLTGLGNTAMIIGALSLGSLFTTYLQIRLTGILGQKALFELRSKIFNKLQELPIRFFAENKSGDIIQRITNDVEYVNRFLSEGVVRLAGLLFGMVFLFFGMLNLNQSLTLVPLASIAIAVVFMVIHGNISRSLNKKNLDKEALVGSSALETLNGYKVIKAYGAEEQSYQNFKHINNISKKIAIQTFATSNFSAPFMDTLTRFGTLVTLVYSAILFNNSVVTIGGVVAYLAYLEQFYRPLSGFANLWSNIQSGIAASQRIDELLTLETNIKAPQHAYSPRIADIKGDLKLNDMYFKYPDADEFVLKAITLHAEPGEKIAIVGQTGAGKTTLVNLIARLHDVTKGSIAIDNVDIKNWDLEKLRSQVGYILQDPFFFEDTVLNNLTYPEHKITKNEVIDVLSKLGALKFIERLPKGLETKLSKNAENISAGQRQILAMARAILKQSKILILDEATARVDTISEKVLDVALEKFTEDVTTIIIAHRLNTIKKADKIVFIYDNTILEYGRREELLSKKGQFYKLYNKFKKDLEVK